MVLSGFSYTNLVSNPNQHWLWYDKYKYKTTFHIAQAGIFKAYDVAYIDRELERANNRATYQKNLTELRKFLLWKEKYVEFVKTLTHRNDITVYSTRYDVLEEIAITLQQPETVEEVLYTFSRPKETIYHKNPKHNFRVFLKSKVYTAKDIQDLQEFFTKYSKHFFPSANLSWFLNWDNRNKNGRWSDGNLFFDYDQEQVQSLFYMTFHEHIKKECMIQKPPEIA
jgi:hypothetical protein